MTHEEKLVRDRSDLEWMLGSCLAIAEGHPCQESDAAVQSCLATQKVFQLRKECEQLEQWVQDLQSGMYVNCVYCGHRYGPDESTPSSMAEVLKAHVEQCPQHPMSQLKTENQRLRKALEAVVKKVEQNRDSDYKFCPGPELFDLIQEALGASKEGS